MTTFRIIAYKRQSKGALNLRDNLREMGHHAYVYDGERNIVNARSIANDVIINWGNSNNVHLVSSRAPTSALGVGLGRYLNFPVGVSRAIDKLNAFRHLEANGVNTPPYTTRRAVAETWIGDGFSVVCRQTLTGHSGQGIVLADGINQLVDAPLYTRYIKKMREYRVHAARGAVIDIQQKRKRADVPNAMDSNRIRNLANNWIYSRNDVDISDENRVRIESLAVQAINALGLDFGAVDIIWNQRDDMFYVLEVNTATGIEGTTALNYARMFANYAETL